MKGLLVQMIMALMAVPSTGFMFNPSSRSETRLFLEDHIARMIDEEIYRQAHKKEYEKEWMDKNRDAVMRYFYSGDSPLSSTMQDDHVFNFGQHRKDRQMAASDPERYCADRCVATGNCDVFEDFYHLSPTEVLKFCEECVLSDDGECNLPEDFYKVGKLMP